MKKLLVFFASFVSLTSLYAMDLGTLGIEQVPVKIRQSPPSLKYLAALHVRQDNQREQLPRNLFGYLIEVQSSAHYKKYLLREAAFKIDQQLLLNQMSPSYEMITTRLEDSYAQSPHLFTQKFVTELLDQSMKAGTLSAVEWLLKNFPELKTDKTLDKYLSWALSQQEAGTTSKRIYNFCMEHLSISYLNQKSADLLALSVSHNRPEFTQHIMLMCPHADPSRAFCIAASNTREECLQLLLPATIQKLKVEAEDKSTPQKPIADNIITMTQRLLDRDLEKTQKTLQLLLNCQPIKEVCQKLLYENIDSIVSRAQHFCLHFQDQARCRFLIPFLDEHYKEKYNKVLNHQFSLLMKRSMDQSTYRGYDSEKGEFFLELGADRLAQNEKGQIPLQVLLSARINQFIYIDGIGHYYLDDEHLKNTLLLLLAKQSQEQLTFVDGHGDTALHYPGAGMVMDILADHGGDVDKFNNREETPLISFFTHNISNLNKKHSFWPTERSYHKIYTGFLIEYLHLTRNTSLLADKRIILRQLESLYTDEFKKELIKRVKECQPHWMYHSAQPVSDATIAKTNKKFPMVENQFNVFGPITTALKAVKPGALYYPQSTKNGTICPRMEDVD